MPALRPARRPRAWRLVGAVVAVVTAGAGLIVLRREDATAAVAEPRLPTSVTARWSAIVPGQVWDVTATDDVVLAAAHGAQLHITALAAATGAELWSRRDDQATLAAVGVIGDIAVFLSSPTRGDDDLVGIDLHTGAERWRHPQPAKDATVLIGGRHLAVTRPAIGTPARIGGVDLLDPVDGSVRASIDGPDVRLGRDDVQVRDGDTFDIYDLDTFEHIPHTSRSRRSPAPRRRWHSPTTASWPSRAMASSSSAPTAGSPMSGHWRRASRPRCRFRSASVTTS